MNEPRREGKNAGPAKSWIAVLLMLAAAQVLAQQTNAPSKTLTFDQDPVGLPPAGFAFDRTGQGPEGRWVVRADPTSRKNHVLVQESHDRIDYRYPLAIAGEGEHRDVALTVRAKPISGEVDQGFGLVWRYKDARNYYVARCNATEDNCRIYRIVNGSRHLFQDKSVPVAKNVWHVLKVEATGDHFVVWFDGAKVLDAVDDAFKDPGRVGLWTKADSVIQFDDFTIEGR